MFGQNEQSSLVHPALRAALVMFLPAKQIERETGVTYKTAWRMFKQIRSMLEENEPIGGKGRDVETDEAFFGGMRKGGGGRRLRGDRGETSKTVVVGMVER